MVMPTVPIVPMKIAEKTVSWTWKTAKRARKILKYGVPAVVFLYGAVKVRGLIRKSKKRKLEKQQQKQIAEIYAELQKQKARG